MIIWDSYPANYRESEIQAIIRAVQAGECVSVVGLSGSGKSNLMGFLAHRITQGPYFCHIDCNDLPAGDFPSLLSAMVEKLDGPKSSPATLESLTLCIKTKLETNSQKLSFLLDRFDLFQLDTPAGKNISNNLRSLRDRFKYELTYVVSTRQSLELSNELSELFFANTIWLGPLSVENAKWSIAQFAGRHGLEWDEAVTEQIYAISRGYPSFLRAVCEAYASGVALTAESMLESAPVRFRLKEFWDAAPDENALVNSCLDGHPLLNSQKDQTLTQSELTALEERLLSYFSAHIGQVCSKEELIQAVWSEEKLVAGLRDDSLTQLVHRLREKIDAAGKNRIQTLSGRGYRFRG